MATVVGVRFKTVGKVYYFDPAGEDYLLGSRVIVETSRGIECGSVTTSWIWLKRNGNRKLLISVVTAKCFPRVSAPTTNIMAL